ncbi:MAG: hypothetical protein WCA30_16620 [Dermatophilaceae bacterium]
MSQTPWRVIGGPAGAHTAPQVTSVAGWARLAVLLTALPVLAALALRGWCLGNGWGGQAPLWRACYSDLPSTLTALRGGGEVSEPVLAALALRLVAAPVRAADASAQSTYVLLWALVGLVLLAVIAVATAAYRIDDPSRALLVVLSPVVPLTLLLSAEIVGVTLAVLALLAWRRRFDAATGVLLALAVFSSSYALILVLVLLAVAARSGRSPRSLLVGLGGGVAVIVGVAALLGELGRITAPVQAWWDAVPSYGSVWLLPSLAGYPLPSWLTPWLVLAGWAAAAALVLWHVGTARRTPATADVALLGVAAVLVTGSAVPVQASLWLVPLVALSSLPWRDMLIWAAAEVVYYPMVWLYLGGLQEPDRGLPAGWYAFFLLLRLAAIGYLMWRVVDLSAEEPGGGHDFLSPSGKGIVHHGSEAWSTHGFSPHAGNVAHLGDPGGPSSAADGPEQRRRPPAG